MKFQWLDFEKHSNFQSCGASKFREIKSRKSGKTDIIIISVKKMKTEVPTQKDLEKIRSEIMSKVLYDV